MKLLLVITMLIAGNIFSAILPGVSSRLLPDSKISNEPADAECTDFSGEWVGTCKSGDTTSPWAYKLKVSQKDCSKLCFQSGMDFICHVINQLNISTTNDSKQNISYTDTISSYWNDKKTVLHFSSSEIQSEHISSSLTSVLFEGKFSLADDLLKAEINVVIPSNHPTAQNFLLTCSLRKF